MVCAETDYQLFDDIFNIEPIQITKTNKDVLKIFADKFEIEDLTKIIEVFEQVLDIISNDNNFQAETEISKELINISEDKFDFLIDKLQDIEKNDNEFLISNFFLTTCFIRPNKIELLINLLKKYEEITKGNQFEEFKKMILKPRKSTPPSEICFITRYLYSIQEINENQILASLKNRYENSSDLIFDKYNFSIEFEDSDDFSVGIQKVDFFSEYSKKGYNPNKIYQSILNDDLDLFTQLIAENSHENKFNEKIQLFDLERNSNLFLEYNKHFRYLDLAAFYGSEKIFNFILLNVDQSKSIEKTTVKFSFISGNISIILKCVETISLDDDLLIDCLYLTIEYNHHEVFEWLIENYDTIESGLFDQKSVNHSFLDKAIKYNNFEVISYLFSIGIDYSSLFVLSLNYSQFNLAKLALNLPYHCNFSSKYIKKIRNSPFSYRYKEIFFVFIF